MSSTPVHPKSLALRIIALLGVMLCWAELAGAGSVQFQLGEQDFADGKSAIYSAEIRAAGAGEPYPFDGTIFGNDLKASLGAFEYVHALDATAAAPPLSAVLTIGLIDIDSPPDFPADTITLMLDGLPQPAALFRGISSAASASSVEVVEVPVPLELIADGALRVTVVATTAGVESIGNAIEADFSRLLVQTGSTAGEPPVVVIDPPPTDGGGGGGNGGGDGDNPPAPVPLPIAAGPAALILAALAGFSRSRLLRTLRI